MKKIIEVYKFDFSERKTSEKQLNKLFKKYGFPNLVVSLQNDYDGLWQVVNRRTQHIEFEMYHSGFVLFRKNDATDKIEVVFTYDIQFDEDRSLVFCDKIDLESNDELQED